jgi:FkbM family methyltransferase
MRKVGKRMYKRHVQPYIRQVLAIATPIEFYAFCTPKRHPILHIGAHVGEESVTYKEYGFQEVNWVEAQPEIFARLIQNVYPESCLQAAVWSERATLEFNVSSNSVSSSLLEFDERTPWKELSTLSKIEVEAITLADAVDVFRQRNLLMDSFFLLLDIQGAELNALSSLSEIGSSVIAISCEVSVTPTYNGGASRKGIFRHLIRNKFIPLSSFLDGNTGHGDQLFVRADRIFLNPKLLLLSIFRAIILKLIIYRSRLN